MAIKKQDSEGTKPTERILELLRRFNTGEMICIDDLVNEALNSEELGEKNLWLNESKPISEKSIRRDFSIIKKYFPESFETIRGNKGEKSCYKAITKEMFNNFMNKDTIALMAQILNLVQRSNILDDIGLSEVDKKILENEIKQYQECYVFITKPFEYKINTDSLLRNIEEAIRNNKTITVGHKENGILKEYKILPYKIVFINENFYLVGEDIAGKYSMSKFRLVNIEKIELHDETFDKDPKILDFIPKMQTTFSNYTPNFKNKLIEVIVEVNATKAKHFKLKKHLLSQSIVEQKENGNLVVSFQVTQEREMEELIKKWIPYMRVIEPLSLKNKIETDLKKYLKI